MRLMVPSGLPDIRITDTIEKHHRRLCDLMHRDFKHEPTDAEVTRWLLQTDSLTPWLATVGTVTKKELSKAVTELVVTLPARESDAFERFLTESVINWVFFTQTRNYRRVVPGGRAAMISYKDYGDVVGPSGSRIKRATRNAGRLVWATDKDHALDGLFEFWVLEEKWSPALEREIEDEYRVELERGSRAA